MRDEVHVLPIPEPRSSFKHDVFQKFLRHYRFLFSIPTKRTALNRMFLPWFCLQHRSALRIRFSLSKYSFFERVQPLWTRFFWSPPNTLFPAFHSWKTKTLVNQVSARTLFFLAESKFLRKPNVGKSFFLGHHSCPVVCSRCISEVSQAPPFASFHSSETEQSQIWCLSEEPCFCLPNWSFTGTRFVILRRFSSQEYFCCPAVFNSCPEKIHCCNYCVLEAFHAQGLPESYSCFCLVQEFRFFFPEQKDVGTSILLRFFLGKLIPEQKARTSVLK